MKKRWFVVILTIGLLLRVLPLSVLALSPRPHHHGFGRHHSGLE